MVVGLAALLLGTASMATWLGAGETRRLSEASDEAETTVVRSVARGMDDPEVRQASVDLRRVVGRRPLDSRARVAYAGLLLARSRKVDDTRAAAFHARRAALLAPVTVPVVRSATLVLARTKDTHEALSLIRSMFAYDPGAAARLLARVEPLLGTGVDSGLPDRPEAWLAWSSQLREDHRAAEADATLELTYSRWPQHLPTLQQLAARASRARDWKALGTLFPDGRELPDLPAAAPALLYRARLKAARQDPEGARQDIDRALALDGDARLVQILAGEACESLGAVEEARRHWSHALFGLRPGDLATRQLLLLRLARLEDRHGQPAAALRLWQSLIQLDPGHAEARRRVDDLTGFRR